MLKSSLSPGLGYESKGADRNDALSPGVYAVTGEVIPTHELGSLAGIGSVTGECVERLRSSGDCGGRKGAGCTAPVTVLSSKED
jgi:hypothetical protein